MADAKKAKPSSLKAAKGGKGASRSKGGVRFILLMIIVGSLVPFGIPTLLFCFGFIPTLVALFTDNDPRKPVLTAIGFMNMAGVAPFVIELWQKGQTMDAALGILRKPDTWLVMFGAAGIGQLLLYAVPPAMAMLTVNRIESRLKTLREGMEQLKAIWGPDVASTKPLNLIRKQETQ